MKKAVCLSPKHTAIAMELPRFGCCCRIGREGVCGLNTGSVNPIFSAAGQQLGIWQQHRFGGEFRACVSSL